MVRVRFAPSPTGTLHIGGVRTALYNYLFAKKHNGKFILRIEDTDQTRYVPGAEDYIIETLKWTGLLPDEGVGFGGDSGPYRQSDRKEIYHRHAHELVNLGHAYFAFDTPEQLENQRAASENFTYNYATRGFMKNSLTCSAAETEEWLASGKPFVIRLLVEPDQEILIRDHIRGEVRVRTEELDDKVLLKADGMPTYHLANIVDDHAMAITHVIRGEEWLPSTAHHVLLYRGFGWEATMPEFCHLPLILKPEGNGKLSKRDGAKFGFPVFPLAWLGNTPEENVVGFREAGFLPEALLNFLALLGWHPSGEQEIFTMDELIAGFDFKEISKSGARFDYNKAKWFNQKYIQALPNEDLAQRIRPSVEQAGYQVSDEKLAQLAGLMRERVTFLDEIVEQGYYLFEQPREYDLEMLSKKWDATKAPVFEGLKNLLASFEPFTSHEMEAAVKEFLNEKGAKVGDYLPLLRIALAGTTKGPAIFDMAEALGRGETLARFDLALSKWG